MTDYSKVLKNGEKAVYDLRALYRSHGYTEFKTGKFEDYELYSENRDFLDKDGILTFTGANGRLMALKPDVTLSVAKDAEWRPGVVQKIYYDDEVYRMSTYSHEFREITQTGIECMGDIRPYDTAEVLTLAEKSLGLIAGDHVLDISHMGVIKAFVDALSLPESEEKRVLECLGQKNAHGIREICESSSVPAEAAENMVTLVETYGDLDDVIGKLEPLLPDSDALSEIKALRDVFSAEGLLGSMRLDFSVVNDMGYYNGIMFQGFIKGIAKPVLSGGRYDNLMHGMGKKCGAIGFSVSLDMLESLRKDSKDVDVDILILYDDVEIEKLNKAVEEYTSKGESVLVEREIPEKIRFGKIVRFKDGAVTEEEVQR